MDEDDIEKKAIEEILLETKRAAERAKEFGSSGWMKPKIPSTNKNFLRNTLVTTLRHPYGMNKHRNFSKYKDRTSYKNTTDDSSPEQASNVSKTKVDSQTSEIPGHKSMPSVTGASNVTERTCKDFGGGGEQSNSDRNCLQSHKRHGDDTEKRHEMSARSSDSKRRKHHKSKHTSSHHNKS